MSRKGPLTIKAAALLLSLVLLSHLFPAPRVDAVSYAVQTSDSDFSSGSLKNVDINGTGTGATLTLGLEGNWTQMNTSASPCVRKGAGLAAVWSTDKVVLFGGYNNSHLNDTWVYDLSENTWTKKSPSTKPAARSYFGFTSVRGDDKLLLFGGDGSGSHFSDTWVYDLSDDNWTNLKPSSAPNGRAYSPLVEFSTDDKFFLFGGDVLEVFDDDVWIYDLSDNQWSQKYMNTPPDRYGHALAAIGTDDKVLMFGGEDPFTNDYMNDTWIFDLSDLKWYEKKPTTSPHDRSYGAMSGLSDSDQAVLFGGLNWGTYNESWIYDLSDNQWYEKTPIFPRPERRQYHAMDCVSGTHKLVLFGGRDAWGTICNDTWVYDVDAYSSLGNYTSHTRDAGGEAEFLNLTWTADVPEAANLTFQIRTARDTSLILGKEFVGPDGNTTSFFNTSGTAPSPSHWEDRYYQIIVYFSTNDTHRTPTLYDLSLTYNLLPSRPKLFAPDNETWLTSADQTFKWTFSDLDSSGQGGFRWQADDDSNFGSVEYDSGKVTSGLSAFTPNFTIRDGTFYWRVKVLDSDGGWGNWSPGRSLRLDAAPPVDFVPVPFPPGWSGTTTPQVDFYTTDNGTGIDHYEVRVDDGGFFTRQSPFVLPPQKDGAHNVTVRAFDRSGHHTDASAMVFVDATPPGEFTPTLGGSGWTNESRPTLFFNTTDDTSGIDRYEVRIGARDYGPQSSPYVLQMQGNGIRTITVKALDRAGNFREGSVNLYVDAEPPAFNNLLMEPSDWSPEDSPMVQFEAYDNISGLSFCELRVDGGAFCLTGSPSRLGPLADGVHAITVRVHDMAGNTAEGTVNAYVDSSPPVSLALSIDDGAQLTTNRSVVLKIVAIDALSGLAGLSLSNDGLGFTPWSPYCESMRWDLVAGDGKKTIHIRVKDRAGNVAETSASIFLATSTAIAGISIAPGSAVVRCGEALQFKAYGYDTKGNPVGELPVSWSAGILGTIDPDGLFTAGANVVSGKVTAVFLDKTAESDVTLVPADSPPAMANNAPVVGRVMPSVTSARVNETVRMSADGSSDVDNDLLDYFFDFGDGLTSGWTANSTADHSFRLPGDYRLRLKVCDSRGAVSNWSVPITLKISEIPVGGGGTNTTISKGAPSNSILHSLALISIGAVIAAVLIWRAARKRKKA